jgi:hypothetical protein
MSGKLRQEALQALHGDFDLLKGGGEAAAQITFTARSEGAPGHARDFLLLK